MIKKLRTKLIIASMLSLLIVLAIILGTAGILNYQNLVADADSVLSLLAENDGHFRSRISLRRGSPLRIKCIGRTLASLPNCPMNPGIFQLLWTAAGT